MDWNEKDVDSFVDAISVTSGDVENGDIFHEPTSETNEMDASQNDIRNRDASFLSCVEYDNANDNVSHRSQNPTAHGKGPFMDRKDTTSRENQISQSNNTPEDEGHTSHANGNTPQNSIPETPPIFNGSPVDRDYVRGQKIPAGESGSGQGTSRQGEGYGSFNNQRNSPPNSRTNALSVSGQFTDGTISHPRRNLADASSQNVNNGENIFKQPTAPPRGDKDSSAYGSYYDEADDENTRLLTSSSDELPLVKKSPMTSPITYKRRWYILTLFSIASLLQGLGWTTFGPITQSCKAVLGWSDSDIALQGIVGNLSYIILCVPVAWMMEKKGMRSTMLVSMFLLTIGFGMRCIVLHPPWAIWTMTVGTIFLGVGSVIPYSGESQISAVWFPAHQRTTATSITALMGFFGAAISFSIGPQVVPDMDQNETISHHHHNHHNHSNDVHPTTHTNHTDLDRERTLMSYLFYGEAAFCALTFVLFLIYFPSKPPTPPSTSAQKQRMELVSGVRSLTRNRAFWIILVAYGLGIGMYGNFSIVLNIDVSPLGVSQKTAGWLGFYGILGACCGGIMISRLIDRFPRQLKSALVFLLVGAAVVLLWFLLIEGRFIPFDWVSMYITTILPAVIIYGAAPLFYELACEAAYPTGEGVTTLILTVVNNFSGCVFLAIFFIPNIGVMWMNYVLLASVVLSIILLLFARVTYHRLNLDSMTVYVDPPEHPHPPPVYTGPKPAGVNYRESINTPGLSSPD